MGPRNATEALGTIGQAAKSVVPALTTRLKDPCRRVQHNTALALARMGKDAGSATSSLIDVTESEHFDVSQIAKVALNLIDSDKKS